MSAAYHAETTSLSSTQLKTYIDSPVDYYEMFVTGKMPKRKATNQTNLGHICHAITLERKTVDEVCRAYPSDCLKSDGSINSKPALAFKDKIFPLIAVKEEMIDQIISICDKVKSSEELGAILNTNAQFEQRIDAVLDGVACRAKPDIHSANAERCIIYDLKFTERIHPDDFWRTARQLMYHVQNAHYTRIAREKYQVPVTFRWWAIEVNYPYRVEPYWLDLQSQETAEEFHQKKLLEFAECQRTGVWKDRWKHEGILSPWDVGANDEGEMVVWTEGVDAEDY